MRSLKPFRFPLLLECDPRFNHKIDLRRSSDSSYDTFIAEAGLPEDAGTVSNGDLTLETLLEEKKQFDTSNKFEKLGVEGGAHGWTKHAPEKPDVVSTLPSSSNVLSIAAGSAGDEPVVDILVTTADRYLHILGAASAELRRSLTGLQDSPILSCAVDASNILFSTSMSGQLTASDLNGQVLEKRKDHLKYVVKVAVFDCATGSIIATASWDGKILMYHSKPGQETQLGNPAASINMPTKPEAMVFLRHPENSQPILMVTRADSSFIYYYTTEDEPRLIGKQNLAPHSNAWVTFTPSAIALCPNDPSLLAVATSTVPHMKLLIVRLLVPPYNEVATPQTSTIPIRTSLLDDSSGTETQASQAAALMIADRENAAILIHCSTMATQTVYSTPALAWRPDGTGIWVNGDDGIVRGIEASSGKVVAKLQGHDVGSKIRCLWAGRVRAGEKDGEVLRTEGTSISWPGTSGSSITTGARTDVPVRDRNALDKLLRTRRVGFYAGIDPTAPSLHLGHLLPLMVLFWLYHHGHHVVSLIGGATAQVGDPSGRLVSRTKTDEDVHESNNGAMTEQVERLWKRAVEYGQRHRLDSDHSGKLELLNNEAWLAKLNILSFLKTMGNGTRIGTMLGRDTVRNKMEKGDGMSFAEFTYPLLQGWDWWQMFRDRGIQVQVGGGDQFGNIVAGMDALKYLAQNESDSALRSQWLDQEGKVQHEYMPMGLTVPLLTTSSGEKFGKSAGNAFLLRSTDDDVERYLKLFTFLPITEITAVMIKHKKDQGKRLAQHLLASEVLELVHGREEAIRTQAQHQALRNPSLASANGSEAVAATLPISLLRELPFSRVLYHAGIVDSKSAGARMIAMGGVYVASSAAAGDDSIAWIPVKNQNPSDFLADGLVMLRLGKWKVRTIKIVEDTDFERQGLSIPGYEKWKNSGTSAQRSGS
nr:tyrosine--trna ligase, mitochondrial [Quercus suber]